MSEYRIIGNFLKNFLELKSFYNLVLIYLVFKALLYFRRSKNNEINVELKLKFNFNIKIVT